MKEINKYQRLRKRLIEGSDPELARQVENYMRSRFKFHGLKTPGHRKGYHDLVKLEEVNKKIDWEFLDQAWIDKHREAQYFACDYLIALEKYLKFKDINHILNCVKSKQWWDTINSLIKPAGSIGLGDGRVSDLMLVWSKDDDFWVRRVAIEHQLLRKGKMSVELLNAILENNLGNPEFFINKAIDWALRDCSETNPDRVKNSISKHHTKVVALSIRKGSKYLSWSLRVI